MSKERKDQFAEMLRPALDGLVDEIDRVVQVNVDAKEKEVDNIVVALRNLVACIDQTRGRPAYEALQKAQIIIEYYDNQNNKET